MLILGVDPGLRNMGLVLLDTQPRMRMHAAMVVGWGTKLPKINALPEVAETLWYDIESWLLANGAERPDIIATEGVSSSGGVIHSVNACVAGTLIQLYGEHIHTEVKAWAPKAWLKELGVKPKSKGLEKMVMDLPGSECIQTIRPPSRRQHCIDAAGVALAEARTGLGLS